MVFSILLLLLFSKIWSTAYEIKQTKEFKMQTVHPPQITNRMIRIAELIVVTGLSRSTIYSKQNIASKQFDPNFPLSIKLGKRAVGWSYIEVLLWLKNIRNKAVK